MLIHRRESREIRISQICLNWINANVRLTVKQLCVHLRRGQTKCNLFGLGITPREDTVRLTRGTPRSGRWKRVRKREAESEWPELAECARDSASRARYAVDGNATLQLAVGPPCSKPTRWKGSRDNVSLEFTIGSVFLVAVWLSCDDDFRRRSTVGTIRPTWRTRPWTGLFEDSKRHSNTVAFSSWQKEIYM